MAKKGKRGASKGRKSAQDGAASKPEPAGASPEAATSSAGADAVSPAPLPAPPVPIWRNRPLIIAFAGALGVIAVVAVAWQWFGKDARLAAPAPATPTKVVVQYVGGKACGECHAQELAAWRGSDHDLAMQVANDKSVLGDFNSARFKYAGTTSRFFQRDRKYFVTTDGPNGKLADFEIKYTFGVHPLQQYLIELPGGRMQALGIAWDSRPKAAGGQRWFHLYPGLNLKAGDPLHWTGVSQTWNFQCAECHSTNLRKAYDAGANAYHTTWSELDVSCEACHGPGANHVAWAKKTGDTQAYDKTKGLLVALDERKGISWTPLGDTGNVQRSAPRKQSSEVDACARCHGRAARISDDDPHGKPPLDTHRYAFLDEGLYWDDGQMREEVYNWGSFLQSKMYAKGVTCSDCHDPHSLKLRAPGNAVCTQCHQAAKFDNQKHTLHAVGTAGASCPACHMPTTTYMVVDPRHDHSIRIPRPDLSVKLGVPNACNNCHAKKSPQWAADVLAAASGKPRDGYQNFTEAFAAGSTGGPGARGRLLALIDDKNEPGIVRASALVRLATWMTRSTLPAVTRSLNDGDPLVRLAAVEAIADADPGIRRQYLPRMLEDPVRSVRIEAARALAGPPEAELRASERTAFDRALVEYVAVQTYNADRPEGRLSLGNLYAARDDVEHAVAEYRKAIELDPTFVQAYVNLADVYRSRAAESEAAAALRAGLAKVPKSAALHHASGLSLIRQKHATEGLRELADAARLEPENARYAYVYAVALYDSQRAKEAVQILEAARRRHPYDRDVLTSLAAYTARAGDRTTALGYARQLTELDPENDEYARIAARIQAGPPPR